jgi:deoxyribodipyrimidine photo-lyase
MPTPAERPARLFPTNRAAALARLQAFVPHAGRRYAEQRNHDPGPGLRDNVSMLSPYLRHRVLTEREVLAAVLQQHSAQAAEKFIQEVFWRSYWKGWLQLRPQVWQAFLRECTSERARLAQRADLQATLASAEAGRTGIDGFDHWARELVQTGYLHNHARMWFASIWIFTLRLPWSLGADFFLRHLLDADPASNTLGWRWVAGLQTPGKTYLARADNIERYTGGAYRPKGLATEAAPVRVEPLPPPQPLQPLRAAPGDRPALLLLHGDDLTGQELLPRGTDLRAVVVASGGHPAYPWPFGEAAGRFVAELAEALVTNPPPPLAEPLGMHPATHLAEPSDTHPAARPRLPQRTPVERLDGLQAAALRGLCRSTSTDCILTPEAPVGPLAEGLARLATELADDGIEIRPLRRPWDALAWPHATHGFFRFREQIPELLSRNRLGEPIP